MPTLLHLDVSPRGDYSVLRHLSRAVVEEWTKNNPGGRVIIVTSRTSLCRLWVFRGSRRHIQHRIDTRRAAGAIAVSNELC